MVEPIQQQQGGCDCGLFAAALCINLAQGGNPAKNIWRQNRMREHLRQCLEAMYLTEFPIAPVKLSLKMKKDKFSNHNPSNMCV